MSPRKIILRELKRLEADAELLAVLRGYAKNETGTRLSAFGQAVLRAGFESRDEVTAADIAKLLDITPGAVSQHYSKFRAGG
ncbi:transcriptional regulator [Sphingomonas sp. SUN039]|uniref:transcriptional regulator n=1 Tax=Sphingomonas sp. SUN039 TaxID=2937787 RepID=UPI0021641933|nr:transcriptional regulator [Sphingomonas sp. SUN039]UVO53972.1 transcriptional regulator [Sphingomonas sp. SUN039]